MVASLRHIRGCSCGAIRYELSADPLIVHACHCRDCQRITGGPFVINPWIEKKYVTAKGAEPRSFSLASGSGRDHVVYFCGSCGTYVWSDYRMVPAECRFVRAGTLDDPSAVVPDIHIFTRTKLPWIELPEGARAVESVYKLAHVWPAEKLIRLRAGA
jgi:hypothetical protein